MKTMGKSIKSFGTKTKEFAQKLSLTTSLCMTILATAGANTYAAGDPASIVKACVDVVVSIFPYIGVFFVVAGIFKLILAYRNDQPEAQAGAAKDIVIGAVFLVFGTFVWDKIANVVF